MRLVLVVAALFVLPALAFQKGDVCALKAPLLVTISRAEGTVETTLDTGTDVEVVVVGDEGRSRIDTGDAKGAVSTLDLEAACAGTLQLCRLATPLTLFESNRSDSRSWRIKEGASISVLRTGKVWAHVRFDDLVGFAKADELLPNCTLMSGKKGSIRETEESAIEDVDRGEGPGVLLLPLLVEDGAPAGTADVLLESFYDRLAYYRPDAGRLPLEGARELVWKKHVQDSAARALKAGLAYVVVGKLGIEEGAKPGFLLSMMLIETATGTTLKAVRARPTLNPKDTWAESTVKALLPFLRTAPGVRQPQVPKLPPAKGARGTMVERPSEDVVLASVAISPAE